MKAKLLQVFFDLNANKTTIFAWPRFPKLVELEHV